eukprot:g7541.t1
MCTEAPADEEANEIFQKAHEKDEKGDHKGYLEDILRFLEYAEKTGNQKWTSVASQNAGIAYNTIGDHEKAVEYHLKHLEMALALGDTTGQKEANENISLCEQLIIANASVSQRLQMFEQGVCHKKIKAANESPKGSTMGQDAKAEATKLDEADTQEMWVLEYIPLYNTGYEDNEHDDTLLSILGNGNAELFKTCDSEGNTMLIQACKHQKLELVKLIVSQGADITVENNEGHTALDYAVEESNSAIINVLVGGFNDFAASKASAWTCIVDQQSGKPYYHNRETNETAWDRPEI